MVCDVCEDEERTGELDLETLAVGSKNDDTQPRKPTKTQQQKVYGRYYTGQRKVARWSNSHRGPTRCAKIELVRAMYVSCVRIRFGRIIEVQSSFVMFMCFRNDGDGR